MSEDLVDWLVRDIEDLLDVSAVGLYEFIWGLRGRDSELTVEEMRPIAEQALEILLSKGNVELVQLLWPSQNPVGNVATRTLKSSDWDDIRQGEPYVALASRS